MLIARAIAFLLTVGAVVRAQAPRFSLEEATIADVHRAIQAGQITCRGLVHAYFDRAKAYNRVINRPDTENGTASLPSAGLLFARTLLTVRVEPIVIARVLPNFQQNALPT